jgi:glycosyltransferase involved in cell wall biosynthesis
MEAVYRLLGDVEYHRMPADPGQSQSFVLAWRTWRSLRKAVTRRDDAVVVVEIAGRGLAEAWAAWLLSRTGRRVWLTVHDAPAVSGAMFLTRALDRPHRRWLPMRLSRTLGRRVERDLLRRADRLMVLSEAGARALEEAYRLDRTALTIPHVLEPSRSIAAENRILVPGYVSGADAVIPLLSGLRSLPSPWRLVVGATSGRTHDELRSEARRIGVEDRVELLGFVDESLLDREFSRAAIVVRWKPDGWTSGSAPYAVSGPIIRALGRGCAVVSNDRRGVVECLSDAGALVVGNGDEGAAEVVSAVSRLAGDEELRLACARAGIAHIALHHGPAVVAALISRNGS